MVPPPFDALSAALPPAPLAEEAPPPAELPAVAPGSPWPCAGGALASPVAEQADTSAQASAQSSAPTIRFCNMTAPRRLVGPALIVECRGTPRAAHKCERTADELPSQDGSSAAAGTGRTSPVESMRNRGYVSGTSS